VYARQDGGSVSYNEEENKGNSRVQINLMLLYLVSVLFAGNNFPLQ
jgi:hypothetical protein